MTAGIYETLPSCPVWDRTKMESRMMNNKAFIREMIKHFLNDVPRKLKKIDSLLLNDDFSGIKFHAHSIAGLSGQMSGDRVHAVAREIERCIAASNRDALTPLILDLNVQFKLLSKELRDSQR